MSVTIRHEESEPYALSVDLGTDCVSTDTEWGSRRLRRPDPTPDS